MDISSSCLPSVSIYKRGDFQIPGKWPLHALEAEHFVRLPLDGVTAAPSMQAISGAQTTLGALRT